MILNYPSDWDRTLLSNLEICFLLRSMIKSLIFPRWTRPPHWRASSMRLVRVSAPAHTPQQNNCNRRTKPFWHIIIHVFVFQLDDEEEPFVLEDTCVMSTDNMDTHSCDTSSLASSDSGDPAHLKRHVLTHDHRVRRTVLFNDLQQNKSNWSSLTDKMPCHEAATS